ncbi:hypothetical protein [Saccharospirillum sp. MSK14-1]|uniref:hypothetical protein n=1 Tax=Saccharospirillum sp. MSK14-1 TaxID=1897632 RepID=UPI0011B223E7|nr:hypothetical protein [Saccharospirillum sp. MSK14-1]
MADSKPGQDFPPMMPDRDDIRNRRPAEPTPAKKAAPKPSPSPKPKATSPTDSGGSSGAGTLVWGLLITALVLVLGLLLLVLSQRQTLAEYDERLQLADDRLVTLEQALTQTDESVAMNETAINARFNSLSEADEFQMSEIRKLWAVSNERNREWIEANQAAVADMQGSLGNVTSRLDSQSETLSTVDGQLDELAALAADLDRAVTAVEGQLNGFDAQAIDERMVSLTLAQENQMMDIGELADQVDNLDRSLDSIDNGRLETNRRLVALSEQLQALDARVTALGGSQ